MSAPLGSIGLRNGAYHRMPCIDHRLQAGSGNIGRAHEQYFHLNHRGFRFDESILSLVLFYYCIKMGKSFFALQRLEVERRF